MDDDSSSVNSVGSQSFASKSSWANMIPSSKAKLASIRANGTLAYLEEVDQSISSLVKRNVKQINNVYSSPLIGMTSAQQQKLYGGKKRSPNKLPKVTFGSWISTF